MFKCVVEVHHVNGFPNRAAFANYESFLNMIQINQIAVFGLNCSRFKRFTKASKSIRRKIIIFSGSVLNVQCCHVHFFVRESLQ